MIVTYKLMLNAEKGGYQAVVDGIKTGDLNTRELYITLSDGGRPLILPENAIATIFGEKEDGTVFFASCEILDDFVIKHVIKTSEINVIGEIKCECRVTSKDKVITSPKFRMIVTDILQDDEAIESQDEFTALTDALARTERAVDEAEQAVNEAQIAVDDAREAALSAENAVSIAGDAVRLADSATAKATEAANNANNAVKNANDALDRAENAETGLGSKLDKVEGTAGNLVVFGPDKSIKDGGKPSKVYTVPYYDNATDEQKAEIKAAIEAMKADSGAYNVLMILNGGEGYSIPAQALITLGTSMIIAVFRASIDASYIVQHNIQLTGAGNVRCWSEEVAFGSGEVTDEQIATAVEAYMAENPVDGGNSGIYVGSDTAPDGTKLQIDPAAGDTFTIPDVLQSTGNSEEDTMSQKAITEAIEALGKGNGAVSSVNGKTGEVSLTAEDVNALPADTEIPTTLPNPNALKFTGAVNGSYDGSEALEVNIPEGGGSTNRTFGNKTLLIDQTVEILADAPVTSISLTMPENVGDFDIFDIYVEKQKPTNEFTSEGMMNFKLMGQHLVYWGFSKMTASYENILMRVYFQRNIVEFAVSSVGFSSNVFQPKQFWDWIKEPTEAQRKDTEFLFQFGTSYSGSITVKIWGYK